MQEAVKKYRHELKYKCTEIQLQLIRHKLKGVLKLDKHAQKEGKYTITSLYFDDYRDSCYWQNEDGVDPREKFRIRIYNHSTERIALECKRKERSKTQKRSCTITEEQCRLLMKGITPEITEDTPEVLRQLVLLMKQQRYMPKVVVEYERIPFINKCGNVRVTLDMNISSSTYIDSFLDERIPKRPVMPLGNHILEVKYDEYLPDYIKSCINIDYLMQTAFSKYYICRKYTI